MHRLALITALLLSLLTFALPAGADDAQPADDQVCSAADALAAIDAGCAGSIVAPEAAASLAQARAAAPALADDFPPSCRLHAEAVFWTANDWLLLSQALADDPSPCADYY